MLLMSCCDKHQNVCVNTKMIWPLNKKKCKKTLAFSLPPLSKILYEYYLSIKKISIILQKSLYPLLRDKKKFIPFPYHTKIFRPPSIKSSGPSPAVIYDRSLKSLHFILARSGASIEFRPLSI